MSEGSENPWLVFSFFYAHQKERDKGSNFHVIAWRPVQADLRQLVICGILQNALLGFEEHLSLQWLGTPSENKEKFNFFASFKIGLCSLSSWQKNPCFGHTSVSHLLSNHRASHLYSPHIGRSNSQFSVAGPLWANRREKAKPLQEEGNPDFSFSGFKQLWWSIPWQVSPSVLKSDWTRAG